MGIILTTSGWTGAEITVVHASGTEVFAPSGDVNNAYDVAGDFATWLDAGGRAWAGALSSITWAVIDDGGRVAFAYAPVGTTFTSFTGNAAALERIAVCKASDGSGQTGTLRGSSSTVPGSVMWDRWDVDAGARNRLATYRMGHGLYSHRRPSVELALDLPQTFAFCEAVRIASEPRTAYLYDEQSDSWRFVTLGRHDIQAMRADDATMTIGTLEVLGGV